MAELTVASTTDTQKDIDLAAGALAADLETAAAAPPGEPPDDDVAAAPPEDADKPKKSAYQKRIDKLTARAAEAERRAEEAERKLQSGPPAAQPEAPQPGQLRAKPKSDDVNTDGTAKYASYDEFIEDLADWKVEQKEAAKAETAQKQTREARIKETFDTYNTNVKAFKAEHPDFDKVVGANMNLPAAAVNAVIRLGDPAIAYYLGQHPEICQELMENVEDDLYVVARIGEIKHELAAGTIQANAETDEDDGEGESGAGHMQPIRRNVSDVPPPIKPVGGSSTKSSVPMDELPYSEYRKIREQQRKSMYRR